MKEVFKKTRYEGIDVSNLGRVRSWFLNRYLKDSPQKFLNPTKGNHGYLQIGSRKHGPILVHRLVVETFKGIKTLHVLHKNNDKTDNRLSNLRYGTPKQNMQDKKAHGTYWIGHKLKRAKLNKRKVLALRAEEGSMSKRALSRKYGISLDTCLKCLDRRTWGQY
jgi:hypothetical protein